MDSLEDLIIQRLEQALDALQHGDFFLPAASRGLATGGPGDAVIRLSLHDVARIAARTAVEHQEQPARSA